MNYKTAILQISERRLAQTEALAQKKDEALHLNQGYRDAVLLYRALVFDEASGRSIDKAKKTKLESDIAAYEKSLNLLLQPPSCKKCSDTGLCGNKPCACAINLMLKNSGDVGLPLHRFDEVDFSFFPEPNRKIAKTVYSQLQQILTKYPNNKVRNIVLMGSTGTGKTHLAGCAADFLLRHGESVAAMTAFALNNRFLKYHTSFDESKGANLDPILDSEFLLIDDLGTESRLKNVTLEYLYLVLNERILKNKLTMVTTNLSPESILSAYGARIYSRLFDKSLTYLQSFGGADLRQK